MRLRAKLIICFILLITGVVSLATIGTCYLVMRQHDAAGRLQVEKGRHLVKNRLADLGRTRLAKAQRFTEKPANLLTMAYLRRIKIDDPGAASRRFITDRPTEEMATMLKERVAEATFDGCYLYDHEDELIASVWRKNGLVTVGIATGKEAGKPAFRYRHHTIAGQQIVSEWRAGPPPERGRFSQAIVRLNLDKPLFWKLGNAIALMGVSPIRKIAETPGAADITLGHLEFYKFLGPKFTGELRAATEMSISIFAGDTLVTGAEPAITHLPESYSPATTSGTRILPYGGQAYYLSFLPLFGLTGPVGTVAIGLSREGTLVRARGNLLMLLAIMAVAIALSIPVAVAAAGRLSATIGQILLTVGEISAGNLDARVDVTAGDELGKLAEAFNQMTTTLSENRNELVEAAESRRSYAEKLEKSNAKLSATGKKYRGIFENAVEGIFQTTPEGRFMDANPSMAKILGYDSPEALVNSVNDIGRQLYVLPHRRLELFRLLAREQTVKNFECQFYRKDGSLIWVSIMGIAVYDNAGRLAFMEGLMEDISGRKAVEDASRSAYDLLEKRVAQRTSELTAVNRKLVHAKETADAATRAKAAFLASMSHEIRTPMNGVIAAADLLLSGKLPPDIGKYVKIIHSSGHSLLAIIDDILDLSKIEAGRLDLETLPFDAGDLLEKTVGMFLGKAQKKGIELIVDAEPRADLAVKGDATRLRQIVANLVGNAAKFTGKGGTITVGVSALPAADEARSALSFFVRDTGIGMSGDYLRTLFDPFSQADASTARKYGGTGLGLSICRQLVERMGGKIRVESEPGRGSTFHFSAVFEKQGGENARRLLLPKDLFGLKVLVIDDNPGCREVADKLLTAFGCNVESTVSGGEALALLVQRRQQSKEFDLIVIDWQMPKLDGIETSKVIRQSLSPHTPIILMTAFGRDDSPMQTEEAGIDGFLTKPLVSLSLFNAVMGVFDREMVETAPDRETAPEETAAHRERVAGSAILVVEDNVANQQIARLVLERAGAAVTIAANGKEALSAVRNTPFDAVLMDIQMPEMNGYDATCAIRKDPKFRALPIIAMTALSMKGDEAKCLAAGMDDYVTKPINQAKLFETLANLIAPQDKPPQEVAAPSETLAPGSLPEFLPPENEALRKPPTLSEASGPDAPVQAGAQALQATAASATAEAAEAAEAAAGSQAPYRKATGEAGDSDIAIPELPGIDIQDPLAMLGIDMETFKEVLSLFLSHNAHTTEKLWEAFDGNDLTALSEIAHDIKGSSANIGATALAESAKRLEMAARGKDSQPPSRTMVKHLTTSLAQFLSSLESLESPQGAPPAQEQEEGFAEGPLPS